MSATFNTTRIEVPVTNLGPVSMEIFEPTGLKAFLTVGHGAGSTMDQPFLKQLCAALADHGIGTARFNFLYSEKRKKVPDRFPVAAAAIRAVIDYVLREYAGVPLFCGGKSFGGRMTSMTLAEHPNPLVKGIVFFGFPLHPTGRPSVERADHLRSLALPLLFLQGTRDALATPELLRPVAKSLANARLLEFEGADHSFKGGKQANVTSLAALTSGWINDHC